MCFLGFSCDVRELRCFGPKAESAFCDKKLELDCSLLDRERVNSVNQRVVR